MVSGQGHLSIAIRSYPHLPLIMKLLTTDHTYIRGIKKKGA